MAGKSSLRTTSFPYYVDTSKPKKPSLPSESDLSNSSTNRNSGFADLGRVDPYNVRAPTRISMFGPSDNYLKKIESPARASHDLTGAGTALIMPILQRNGSQAKQKKGINGRTRMLLGHCFDKKGVHINRHHQPRRSSSERIEEVEMDLEESRKSIEVFGSGAAATVKGEVAKNMERKLSMLTWDAIPPKPQTQTAPSPRNGDDVASDASSDLFEIENISGPTAAADDDDADASSFCTGTPVSRYAPSEVSIQWSVVTTAANDGGAGKGCKEAQKGRRQGGILGCRNQKAVDVAQNVASKNQDKGKLLLPALK